jgi:hypothetical protein
MKTKLILVLITLITANFGFCASEEPSSELTVTISGDSEETVNVDSQEKLEEILDNLKSDFNYAFYTSKAKPAAADGTILNLSLIVKAGMSQAGLELVMTGNADGGATIKLLSKAKLKAKLTESR